MTGTGIQVTGLDETTNMLQQVKRELFEFEIDQALTQGALVIEGEAKRRCPVDTGRLRGSITHAIADDNTATEHRAWVGTNVHYAPYIEYGTGLCAENGNGRKTPWVWQGSGVKWGGWHRTTGMPAQPFLRPALEARRNEAIQTIRDYLAQKYGGGQ